MILNPIAEYYSSKVLSPHKSEKQAKQVIRLLQTQGVKPHQIELIEPDEKEIGNKLEPEQDNIARTAVRSHLLFGGIGLAGGLITAALLASFGPAFAAANPGLTLMALALIGLFIGLIAGGAVSLRPDHDRFLMKALTSKGKQLWTVVIHVENREEKLTTWKTIQQANQY